MAPSTRRTRKKKNSTDGNKSSAMLVKEQLPLLTALGKIKNVNTRSQLLHASPNTVRAVGKIMQNLYAGNIPLSKAQQARVRKMEKKVMIMSSPRTSLRKQKAFLSTQQGGGLIFPLISALAPVVGSLIGSLTGRQ